MRRTSDDAPVLPIFPHAYLPDGEVYLQSKITSETTLQWHLVSIGQTVSFGWKHGLYVREPIFDRYLYGRFYASLPDTDLSSRQSDLFDKAYSYHKCRSTSFSYEEVSGYPPCASSEARFQYVPRSREEEIPFQWDMIGNLERTTEIPASADALSMDDFFVDVNLLLGIPAPALDVDGAGGWQAYEMGVFPDLDPNCTGSYGDAGVVTSFWAWGFFSTSIPYVSHNEQGYDPLKPGAQGKWLAEFGISRPNGVLPAFAFSIMPKMIPMIAPRGVGSNFPVTIMEEDFEVRSLIAPLIGKDYVSVTSTGMHLWGIGAFYLLTNYSYALYTMYFALGIYLLIYAICVVMVTAALRFKMDSKMAG